MHRTLAAAVPALLLTLACGRQTASGTSPPIPDRPTFTRDIAPIVFSNCAPCHHEGGAGPFPLLTYDDVRRRGRQIAEVTRERFMPPWPPVAGHGRFKGERRLTPAQIETIGRWVTQGLPEGDPADRPPAPALASGWQLGTPDLVLTPPEAWTLPAEGEDAFYNFVLPVPLRTPRYVRAIEIRPGNARILHHANALVDPSGVGRARDREEPGPGFPGMDLEIASGRFEPDSHFLFWKPGTSVDAARHDIPWTIEPGTDLVLNLHLRPSGKPEAVQPSLGLYFTDRPPTEFPMLLQLEHDGALDIPPGDREFSVTDELELPVDVTVLAVYPHAHYVAREIQGTARLPDGSTRWLIHIDDWNLDWQAVYELERPLALPRGTVLSMRWTYDNSAANPRNPHDTPRRVTAGNRASDEMSHLWVQVLPKRRDDRVLLQEALMRARLRKYPGDFVANANLGSLLLDRGRLEEAREHLQAAVAARPDHAAARNNLAAVLRQSGDLDGAIRELIATLRSDPDYLPARYNLAAALLARGRPGDAVPHLRRVLAATPDDAAALNDLGSALAMTGKGKEAAAAFARALELRPDNAAAHFNLGLLAARAGRLAEAIEHFERARALQPDDPQIADALARARAAR